mmetsp:Transcript_88293/g.222846  ORF Transcript_88293/g.222846 Transcript_88293/m.222846 type:complete len:278 (-) Transcript_88293:390-1223(-)
MSEASFAFSAILLLKIFSLRRRFFSLASQMWQNWQEMPFEQPAVWKKAQGLQSPELCPADPRLGSSTDPNAGLSGGGAEGAVGGVAFRIAAPRVEPPEDIRGGSAGGAGGMGTRGDPSGPADAPGINLLNSIGSLGGAGSPIASASERIVWLFVFTWARETMGVIGGLATGVTGGCRMGIVREEPARQKASPPWDVEYRHTGVYMLAWRTGVNWAIVVPASDGDNSPFCQSAGLSLLGHRVGASGTICWNGKHMFEHVSGKPLRSSLSLQARPTCTL